MTEMWPPSLAGFQNKSIRGGRGQANDWVDVLQPVGKSSRRRTRTHDLNGKDSNGAEDEDTEPVLQCRIHSKQDKELISTL